MLIIATLALPLPITPVPIGNRRGALTVNLSIPPRIVANCVLRCERLAGCDDGLIRL
jgi:hypothetical protein